MSRLDMLAIATLFGFLHLTQIIMLSILLEARRRKRWPRLWRRARPSEDDYQLGDAARRARVDDEQQMPGHPPPPTPEASALERAAWKALMERRHLSGGR